MPIHEEADRGDSKDALKRYQRVRRTLRGNNFKEGVRNISNYIKIRQNMY